MNSAAQKLIVFILDDQRFALPLPAVERVIRMVEIAPIPKAPEIVTGVINVKGHIIPVVDIRRRFRLPGRETGISDQVLISHTSKRPVGIVVDEVTGVIECSAEEIVAAEKILPGMEYVEGVAKLKDGMILIHNIDSFLSLEEERALDDAIHGSGK